MRWYFAIDEAGTYGETGADAKTAVLSARAFGQLDPHLLYYGKRNDFTAWMTQHGVTVIDAAPHFLPIIQAAEQAGIYKAHSIGHWLRVVLPQVETTQEFVLYTDCDVIFLNKVDWQNIRPKVFAAAPEFKRDNWNYFNAGVMVVNIPAMQLSYNLFETQICSRIEATDSYSYDDQQALNEAYRGLWDRLDVRLNWKPYWGYNSKAAILHFHGPKLSVLESIASGHWNADNPTAIQLRLMVDGHLPAYIAWAGMLGDRLQNQDVKLALRLQAAASALTRYQSTRAGVAVDTSFMDFNMF
ncbi:MAG: hypothetical protein B7Z75_01485 [Acidocella sp. 20-57-95]|nr:MAG: hypothetical protein B7Z75_01485 [Acidocella sp. 20-57-95]OYV62715.1 MAG: hypothetical protein B7Z71_00035 [Acidocella sp. 21-58-7]HQT65379.1 glycosyltransferase [Acidocella sp.]HQU03266.1 glycosyltransferase [Acidocella sp.]